MTNSQTTKDALAQVASTYAESILHSIQQEYPNQMQHMTTGPDDRPTPREAHPAFYGCFDWHSSVEMHWVLIRLMRFAPEAFDINKTMAALDAHLTPEALAQETAYLRSHPRFERPYGWGWALTFVHELTVWDDDHASRWLEASRPLADVITEGFLSWLPKATYPIRIGMHSNSAFGLARAVPWARHLASHGDSRLLNAITKAAIQWYGADRDYPAHYEPSGTDFLSPALTEVDLMSLVLEREEFFTWLDAFLPKLASGDPKSLFEPAFVSDASDGQLAHLHGLNLYRAFVWKHLSETLPADDIRRPHLEAGSDVHTKASMGAVTGSDYMVEHWLAAYAMLYLSGG
ncbi:MAG: DUF2891 domain-containing protein [Anaerolineales bacterium]|nr:DUF2891 domain-containing protein [Anaerolineales bacterium]